MEPDADIDRSFRRAARVLSRAALLLALVVLAGWVFGVEALSRPVRSVAPMTPLGALTFAVLAGAARLQVLTRPGAVRAGRALGAVGGGVGFVALGGHVLGQPLAADLGVFDADGEIAVMSATVMLLLGLGLCINGAGHAGLHLARLSVLLGIAVTVAALVGYAVGVDVFYGANRTVQMSPVTATIGLLTSGAAAAVVRGPLQEMFFMRTLGGTFLRQALPLVLAIQVVTATLATTGDRADLWAPSTAVWLMTLSALLCLAVLIVFSALRLHAADLQRVRDAEHLTELARRDPLTGALNRRAFGEEVERSAAHLRRYGGTGAICVIDLDHFKEVNDRYGHQAGDEVLARVHRGLFSRLRTTDVLGRLGGDEFAVLLPIADELTAESVAQELRDVIEQLARAMEAEDRPTRLGASVGCALMTGGEAASELLDAADARMYAAKRAARAA